MTSIITGHPTQAELNMNLFEAVRNNKSTEIETAIKMGADLNATEADTAFTPLILAMKKGFKDIAKLLILAGADVHREGGLFAFHDKTTPMNYAITRKLPDIAMLLFEKKASIHLKDENGVAPLQTAVEADDPNMVVTLLNRNANLFPGPDRTGSTPLTKAIDQESVPMVSLLLDYATKKLASHTVVPAISRCLHESFYTHRLKPHRVTILKKLIDAKASVDTFDSNKLTPLMLAARWVDYETVKLLLKEGAQPNLVEPTTKSSALHIALESIL